MTLSRLVVGRAADARLPRGAAGAERPMAPTPVLLLGNPMDGGAWWAAVRGVTKSRTRLSDFTFTFQFHAWEKEMATHSSTLAGKSHGQRSLLGYSLWGYKRVGHD